MESMSPTGQKAEDNKQFSTLKILRLEVNFEFFLFQVNTYIQLKICFSLIIHAVDSERCGRSWMQTLSKYCVLIQVTNENKTMLLKQFVRHLMKMNMTRMPKKHYGTQEHLLHFPLGIRQPLLYLKQYEYLNYLNISIVSTVIALFIENEKLA